MNTEVDVLPDLKLKFNVAHPGLEECYAYGYACALASMQCEENPYPQGSRLSEQWEEGWWDGFYGNAPLHELDWLTTEHAVNDQVYISRPFLMTLLKITGTLAATALVGYQLFEWVA